MNTDLAQVSLDAHPRLYRDLTDWYPLPIPVGDYVEEAAFYRQLFETHCHRSPRSLLDLGSGIGGQTLHLAGLTVPLVVVLTRCLKETG